MEISYKLRIHAGTKLCEIIIKLVAREMEDSFQENIFNKKRKKGIDIVIIQCCKIGKIYLLFGPI